jgi:serine/threonine protein kinase
MFEIKIVDFGISGISTFNADKPNAGSLMYMAPEVLTGKIKKIGPSIDVWGIGVMMYAMLCGTLPFGGESQDDIVQAIV